MAIARKIDRDGISRLPIRQRGAVLAPALRELADMLLHACPPETTVGFRYDRKLHVDLDVRGAENAILVERLLPTLRLGMFTEVRRAMTPRPFLLRITAEVEA